MHKFFKNLFYTLLKIFKEMKNRVLVAFIALFSMSFVLKAQEDTQKDDFKKWQVRFRVLAIAPSVGDNLTIGSVDISTAVTPELDFTYFFTKNIAAELILATSKHDVSVDVATGGNIDLGRVWLLPPTINLQYHFYTGDLKPYIGAGVNYTFFYGVDEGEVVAVDYDNSFSFSFQVGMDYMLNDKWFLNLDLKKLLLSTDVAVTTAPNNVIPVEVDINPLVIGLGFGLKF